MNFFLLAMWQICTIYFIIPTAVKYFHYPLFHKWGNWELDQRGVRVHRNASPGRPNPVLLFPLHLILDSLTAPGPNAPALLRSLPLHTGAFLLRFPSPSTDTTFRLTSSPPHCFRSYFSLTRFSSQGFLPNPFTPNPKLYTHDTLRLRVRERNWKTKVKPRSVAAPLSVPESGQSRRSLHGPLDCAPMGRAFTQRPAPISPLLAVLPAAQRSLGNVVFFCLELCAGRCSWAATRSSRDG